MTTQAVPILMSTFEQAEYWIDRHGNQYALTSMTQGYLENVLAFLRARPEEFHGAALLAEHSELFLAGFDDIEAQGWVPTVQSMTATEWLEQTPLIQAITALLSDTETKEKR